MLCSQACVIISSNTHRHDLPIECYRPSAVNWSGDQAHAAEFRTRSLATILSPWQLLTSLPHGPAARSGRCCFKVISVCFCTILSSFLSNCLLSEPHLTTSHLRVACWPSYSVSGPCPMAPAVQLGRVPRRRDLVTGHSRLAMVKSVGQWVWIQLYFSPPKRKERKGNKERKCQDPKGKMHRYPC